MISTQSILSTIENAGIGLKGYSTGAVAYNSVNLDELLEAMPEVHIDIIAPNTYAVMMELERYIRLKRRDLNLIHRDKIPKYMTPLTIYGNFYDFVVVDNGNDIFDSLWKLVKRGGIMIDSGLHTEGEFGILEKERSIVISGCYRGATKYIVNVMQWMDIAINHQQYGKDGIVAGAMAVVLSPPGSVILHQVREPIATIRSAAILATTLSEFTDAFIGYRYTGDDLLWAMHYWYYWHRLCDRNSIWTYRVEALHEQFDKFCMIIDAPICKMPEIPENTNMWKNEVCPRVNWKILSRRDKKLTEQIRGLAEEYGYNY